MGDTASPAQSLVALVSSLVQSPNPVLGCQLRLPRPLHLMLLSKHRKQNSDRKLSGTDLKRVGADVLLAFNVAGMTMDALAQARMQSWEVRLLVLECSIHCM